MEVSCKLYVQVVLPPGMYPGTHWLGGWVGPPQSIWTFYRRDKSVASDEIRIPDRPTRSLVAVSRTLSQITNNEEDIR